MMKQIILIFTLLASVGSAQSRKTHSSDPQDAKVVTIAVASNFRSTFEKLTAKFEATDPGQIIGVYGSTRRLYAQIINGAPFSAFLSADNQTAVLLERNGRAVAKTRFVYAHGRLSIWSPRKPLTAATNRIELFTKKNQKIALANPKLAPYGQAALDYLNKLLPDQKSRVSYIYGENVGQTFHYLHSGAASLGFVALSQLLDAKIPAEQYQTIPENSHGPLIQEAILVKEDPLARRFLDFLQTPEALKVIRSSGYLTKKEESVVL